jgi:hypothetical protein
MVNARHSLLAAATAVLVNALIAATPVLAQSSSGRTIACESRDGGYHRCDVATEGNVELVRRLSWVSCEQGRTWGYDPRGIWVDQGCRAEFRYGQRMSVGSTTGRTLVCESRNGQYRYCQAPTQGSAQLRRRLSSANCVQGDSWGYDNAGIWVSDDCRAEFAFGRDAAPASAGSGVAADSWKPAGRLTCESQGGSYKLCKASTQGKVRVAKQLSRDECVEGQTWGQDASGIWVTGGCRAQFDYGIAKSATAAASATTVTCESIGDEGKRCKIGDTGKVTVKLQKQLSRTECIKDDTWGVDQHSLWVTGGCRATFTVTPIASASATTANAGYGDSWNQPGGGTSLNSTVNGNGATGGSVPSWMVGTFNGYNPLYDAGMQMTIGQDGRVTATVGGTRLTGWYAEGKLVLGGVDYTVRRDQGGFRTVQDNDPGNQVVYSRVR